jgi:hypothetical protein
MQRTTRPVTTIENSGVRTKMIRSAMACNKFLTVEYLCFKPSDFILCFTHPDDREGYIRDLEKGGSELSIN